MKTQTWGFGRRCTSIDPRCQWVNYVSEFHFFLFSSSGFVALEGSARDEYKKHRFNGTQEDFEKNDPPYDGKITWIKGRVNGDRVYGVRNTRYECEYECRYDEGPGDKAWMEENDRNYQARLARERLPREKAAVLDALAQVYDGSRAVLKMDDILKSYAHPDLPARNLTADEMTQIFQSLIQNKILQALQPCEDLAGTEETLADLILARPELAILPPIQSLPKVNAIVEQKRHKAEQKAAKKVKREEQEVPQRKTEQEHVLEESVPYKCAKILKDALLKAPSFANMNLAKHAVDVAKLLDARPDFTAIDLTNTNLSDRDWQIILGVLRKNRVVTQIDFDRSATATEIQGQIDALIALNRGERNLLLQSLGLESRTSFSYVLGSLADHAITRLNLSSFALTIERAQILGEFISRNRRLATLNLHGVQCTGDAGYILLEAIKQNMPLNIDFTDAQLDRDTAFILCEIVRDKPIATINFTNCSIPPLGRNGLQTALQQNSLLQEVIGSPVVAPSLVAPVGHGALFTPPSPSPVPAQSPSTNPNVPTSPVPNTK